MLNNQFPELNPNLQVSALCLRQEPRKQAAHNRKPAIESHGNVWRTPVQDSGHKWRYYRSQPSN